MGDLIEWSYTRPDRTGRLKPMLKTHTNYRKSQSARAAVWFNGARNKEFLADEDEDR